MLKNNRKHFIWFIVILILCIKLPAAFSDTIQWRQATQTPFFIFYTDADTANAREVLDILHSAYPKLEADFNYTVDSPVNVFICPSQAVFDRVTDHLIPEWGEAAADISRRMIVLKSPNWITYRVDLRTSLIHELTHIFVGCIASGHSIPRWLNEGIAIHYSEDVNYASGDLISKAMLTNSVIPLNDIDSVLKFYRHKANLAYQESYMAVRFFVEQYGEDALSELIQRLGQGQSVDEIFREIFGSDFLAFEQAWLESLQSRYKWSFLESFGNYVWALIGLLFVIAILSYYWRRRQILKRWEEEENFFD